MNIISLLIIFLSILLNVYAVEVIINPYADLYESDYYEIKSFHYPEKEKTDCDCECGYEF